MKKKNLFKKWNILKDTFLFSFDNLVRNKLRSSLTTLGITIGVFTVIVIISLINGMNVSVKNELSFLGTDLFIIQKIPYKNLTWAEYREAMRKNKNITMQTAYYLKELPNVASVSPISYIGSYISYENKKSTNPLFAIGVTREVLDIFNDKVSEGRFFSDIENETNQKVCIIGHDIKEEFFPHISPLGKNIKIKGHQFRIIGVMEYVKPFMGDNRNDRIYVPIFTLLNKVQNQETIELWVKAKSSQLLSVAMDDATQLLRRLHNLKPDDENDFGMAEQSTFMNFYNNFTRTAKIVMILISSISLIVGGVGIMNIMLVSVKERTKEIGLRKAIGATYHNILQQFLLESIFLCLIGGALGLIFGSSLAIILGKITPIPITVPWWSIAISLLIPTAVGLIFGIYPASRAAKLDPIESLRYE